MANGRQVLKYFTEADLAPYANTSSAPRQPVIILPAHALFSLRQFAESFGRDGENILQEQALADDPHLVTFLALCEVLGAVTVKVDGGVVRVRARGRLGAHVPEILCHYLANSFTVFESWSNTHLIPEDRVSALEFVQQLELRRIEQERRAGRFPQPLAERPVAFALFRAKNDKGESCYLFEINKDWRRLNFIGGKQESRDRGDFIETLKREIAEELGIGRGRLTITHLTDQPLVGYSLSGNVGSLARYPCELFGVQVEGELKVRMQDRWLTEDTIRACAQSDDSPLMVNPVYLDFLLSGRPPMLTRVPLSTNAVVRSTPLREILPDGESFGHRWLRVARENKDLVAAVLTIAAAIIGLIVAL